MAEELEGLVGIGEEVGEIEEAAGVLETKKVRETLTAIMEICGGFMELLRSNCAYSFTSIQRDFWESIVRANWLDEERKSRMIEKRAESVRQRDHAADSLKNFLYYYQSILETFGDIGELKISHMENVLSVLQDILRSANKEIITPFVNLTGEAQRINARSFDNFSIFRERCNHLLQTAEERVGSLGMDGFNSMELRIPELGVTVKQSR
jgi:hypothetical protein